VGGVDSGHYRSKTLRDLLIEKIQTGVSEKLNEQEYAIDTVWENRFSLVSKLIL